MRGVGQGEAKGEGERSGRVGTVFCRDDSQNETHVAAAAAAAAATARKQGENTATSKNSAFCPRRLRDSLEVALDIYFLGQRQSGGKEEGERGGGGEREKRGPSHASRSFFASFALRARSFFFSSFDLDPLALSVPPLSRAKKKGISAPSLQKQNPPPLPP